MRPVLNTFALTFALMMVLKFLPRPLQWLKLAVRRLAARRALCIALAGAIPVLIHLALYPQPEPIIQDEFAYLLQADTFAHGRLANPPLPLWEHFEQFHVISQPVFAAKYQPLPAALLAIGQIAGNPYYGLMLTAALTFSAVMWMLYGWLPPSYAVLGWIIAISQWGPTTYWMNSYWGGLVPAMGGALVLGAWPRLRKIANAATGTARRDAVWLGIGMAALAASRPYEGFVLSAAACAALLLANRNAWRSMLWATPVIGAAGAWLLYYNFRITGSAWMLPYVLHDAQYSAVGNFFFIPPKMAMPAYRHPEFKQMFADQYVQVYRDFQAHPWKMQLNKLKDLFAFYFGGWPLGVALVGAPFSCKNKSLRWAAFMLGIFLCGLALLVAILPHYAAPAASLFLLIQVGGLHALRYWNPQNKPTGSLLARVAMLAVTALFLQSVIERPEGYATGNPALKALRRDLFKKLDAIPGEHLVLVRYSPTRVMDINFVDNGAALPSQRILWARAMGAQKDQELIRYFRQRQAWLFDEQALTLHCVDRCANANASLLDVTPVTSAAAVTKP